MAIRKVLVCDDSTADRTNLERIVSGTGCVVITANNGKEALVQVHATFFAIACLRCSTYLHVK